MTVSLHNKAKTGKPEWAATKPMSVASVAPILFAIIDHNRSWRMEPKASDKSVLNNCPLPHEVISVGETHSKPMRFGDHYHDANILQSRAPGLRMAIAYFNRAWASPRGWPSTATTIKAARTAKTENRRENWHSDLKPCFQCRCWTQLNSRPGCALHHGLFRILSSAT